MTTPDSDSGPGKIPIVLGVLGQEVNDDPPESVTPQFKSFFIQIREQFPHSPFVLLSSLLNAHERFVVKLVLDELEASLFVPLPCTLENVFQNFVTPENQSEFQEVLDRAQGIMNVASHSV